MSDKLKILSSPANEGGCAYYRCLMPYEKLKQLYPDKVEVRFNKNPLGLDTSTGHWIPDWDFEDMKWADVIMINNICNFGGQYTARVVGKGRKFGKFIHFDTDDLLTDLYKGHRLENVYKEKGLSDITKFVYSHSHLVTVTQRKFAERIKEYCGGVLAVVKNSIDYMLPCWNVPKTTPKRKKLVRVGWAGGIHHEEDVKEFVGVPGMVNSRVGRENIKWDFYGAPPLAPGAKKDWQHEVWDNYKRLMLLGFKGAKNWQIHLALPPNNYGGLYANVDVAIAPLQMNNFNDSKSEIKVAECGRYKIPLVATNVGCYDETIVNGETGFLIEHDAPRSEWVKALTKITKDHKLRKRMGENLHKITEEYFDINKVVKHRLSLYEECFSIFPKELRDGVKFNVGWKNG